MTLISVGLGFMLLSNHEGVKERAAEVERVEEDLIDLVEDIHHLSQMEHRREEMLLEKERLARERLHWTAPDEFIVKIREAEGLR